MMVKKKIDWDKPKKGLLNSINAISQTITQTVHPPSTFQVETPFTLQAPSNQASNMPYPRTKEVDAKRKKKNRAEAKADKGDTNAQFTVGFMYLQGEGCEQNFVKAKAMFEAAAEQDDADAQYNLGLMFDQSGDVTKAKKWYKRATDKDHEKARNNLDALNYRSDGGGTSSLNIKPIRDETFEEVLVKDPDGRKQRNTCGTQSMHDAVSFFLQKTSYF